MAGFFLSEDDFEDEIIDILPENQPIFELFQEMSTQWRVGFNGITGLDYNVLFELMRWRKIEDKASTLQHLRIMENAVLNIVHKSK